MPFSASNALTFIYAASFRSQIFRAALAPACSLSAVRAETPKMHVREVKKVVIAREQPEGDGARVRRSIGRAELPNLDPFLLLDEFKVRKPAGFPKYVLFPVVFSGPQSH